MRVEQVKEVWVRDFTEEAAKKFRDEVYAHFQKDKTYPVLINIDSYGGKVDSLAVMIETIDELRISKCKFITCCTGKAMSCGAILLSHGDIRFCSPMSRVMVHEVSAGAIGTVTEIVARVEQIKELNDRWIGLLAKNCKVPNGLDGLMSMIKEKDGHDIYLNAQQALDFGIVDHVGWPKFEIDVKCSVQT